MDPLRHGTSHVSAQRAIIVPFSFNMDFYLVRHGEAKSEMEDPMRPLSERGREEVERVARAAVEKSIVKVAQILHSDKLRARETAGILARFLHPVDGVHEVEGLGPQDDPLVTKAELEAAESPLILVGHLPHLSRLTSLLVAGDALREIVAFAPAALACLSYEDWVWKVRWSLDPGSI